MQDPRRSHPWHRVRFVLKLDPDRTLPTGVWDAIRASRPDLILVGGTQNISGNKVASLIEQIQGQFHTARIWQEVSNIESIYPGLEGYALPCVVNSSSPEWMIRAHVTAIERYGNLIPWEKVMVEGYLVLNPASAVGQLTGASELPDSRALAFVEAAYRVWNLQTLYIEYSGNWGDMKLLRRIRQHFPGHLIYGGGINSAQRAKESIQTVDTLVVGNAIYEEAPHKLTEISACIRES